MRAAERRRSQSTKVLVRRAPRDKKRAIVQFGALRVPAAIGRSGTSAIKREGDGATPIGPMTVLYGFRRGERVRFLPAAIPLRRIRADMLWCDDPADPNYNRLVRAPFRPSHEEMKRRDGLYNICIVLDWNIRSRRRNCGSAIFLHLIRPGFEPTAGCIAIGLSDMKRLLAFLRPGSVIRVL